MLHDGNNMHISIEMMTIMLKTTSINHIEVVGIQINRRVSCENFFLQKFFFKDE